jgi:hypothetical protein
MAAIDFPNSPSTNDTFSVAGKTWIYNGVSWTLVASNYIAEPSTSSLDGGTPQTIQFNVMGAVDAGEV